MNTNAANYLEFKKMCEKHKIEKINPALIERKLDKIMPKYLKENIQINVYGKEQPFAVFSVEIIISENPEVLFKNHIREFKDFLTELTRKFLVKSENIYLIVATNDDTVAAGLEKVGGIKLKGPNKKANNEIKEFKIENEAETVDNLEEIVNKKNETLIIDSFESILKDLVERVDSENLDPFVKEKVLEKLIESLLWYSYAK